MPTEIADNWLAHWMPDIVSRADEEEIIELGCGDGRDTGTLQAAGVKVIGVDKDAIAISTAAHKYPRCTFHVADLRDAFPIRHQSVPVIIASLCLHYFSLDETADLIAQIHAQCAVGGLLLCRLNSTADVNYGAGGVRQIEENYYQIGNETKRFFDEATVDWLFSNGWLVAHRQHMRINRYEQPKAVWEIAAVRQA